MSNTLVGERVLEQHQHKLPEGLILANYDVYEPEAPLTQYITSRVNYLFGEDGVQPAVFVIHEGEPNAFTDGKAIYVHDGLLGILDHQEELDAVLAHELVHYNKGHVANVAKQDSFLTTIGAARLAETEADIYAMALLDKRDIDPRGMLSAYEKLQAYETENNINLPIWSKHSTVHGSTQDRRVNIGQLLWVHDVRSLGSTGLTPVPLSSDQYGATADPERYNDPSLPPEVRQGLLIRQAAQGGPIDNQAILESQKELLRESNPTTSQEIIDRAAVTIISTFTDKNEQTNESTWLESAEPQLLALEEVSLPVNKDILKGLQNEHFNALLETTLPYLIESEALPKTMKSLRKLFDNEFGANVLLDAITSPERKSSEITVIAKELAQTRVSLDYISKLFVLIPHKNELETEIAILNGKKALSIIGQERLEQAESLLENDNIVGALAFLAEYSHVMYKSDDDNDDPPFSVTIEDIFQKDITTFEFDYWGISSSPSEFHNVVIGLKDDNDRSPNKELVQESIYGEVFYDGTIMLDPDDNDRPKHKNLEYDFHVHDEMSDYTRLRNQFGATLREQLQSSNWPKLLAEVNNLPDNKTRLMTLSLLRNLDFESNPALDKNLLIDIITGDTKLLGESLEAYLKNCKHDWETPYLDIIKATDNNNKRNEQNRAFKKEQDKVAWLKSGLENVTQLIEGLTASGIIVPDLAEIIQASDYAKDAILLRTLYEIRDKSINDYVDLSQLESLVKQFPIAKIRNEFTNFSDKTNESEKVTKLWLSALEDFNSSTRQKDLESLTTKQLYQLLALSLMSQEISVAASLPGACITQLVKNMSFAKGYKLIFEELANLPSYCLSPAIDYLIEYKAHNSAQLQKIEEKLTAKLENFLEENYSTLGVGAIIDSHIINEYKEMKTTQRQTSIQVETINGMQASNLLAAILETGQNPDKFQEYLFERWWLRHRYSDNSDVTNFFSVEDYAFYALPGKQARLDWWVNREIPPAKYSSLDSWSEGSYLSNAAARYITLRKLLLGEGGVLTDQKGRDDLIDALEESWLSFDNDDNAAKLVHNILVSIINSQEPEELYKYIAPVLQELILRPPQRQPNNSPIAQKKAQEILEELVSRRRLSVIREKDVQLLSRRIERIMGGSSLQDEQNKQTEKLHDDTPNVEDAFRILKRFLPEDNERPIGRLSPVQLAILLGKKSGAIGVRMLQLGGQYYPIPDEDKDEFREIYDQMRGQSRLQAFRLLKREAEHVPEIQDLMKDIKTFGGRIGGGSLVTVYDVKLNNGSHEVVGVRNPNAAYHVSEVATLADTTLDLAIAQDPENVDLRLAKALVYDAVEWINEELHDSDFEAKDSVYHVENDTREEQLAAQRIMNRGRSKYHIMVPYTKPTGSLWVRREEFIDGHNLNGLEIADQTDIASGKITKEDHKQVISTLIRNYCAQLLKGSYAHSDVHPGNFRITSDNQNVAILDRYNLIPITSERRAQIKTIFSSVVSGNIGSALTTLLQASNADQIIDPSVIQSLSSNVSSSNDPTKAATQSIVELKKRGVHIPLELSLIMRNIFALFGMAQEAGFNSITEAFVHTAEPNEILETLQEFGIN